MPTNDHTNRYLIIDDSDIHLLYFYGRWCAGIASDRLHSRAEVMGAGLSFQRIAIGRPARITYVIWDSELDADTP